MTKTPDAPRVLILSSCWEQTGSEAALSVRSITAAISRFCNVDVLVKSDRYAQVADGLFDLHLIACNSISGLWPDPGAIKWPTEISKHPLIAMIDPGDSDAIKLVRSLNQNSIILQWGAVAESKVGRTARHKQQKPLEADFYLELIEMDLLLKGNAETDLSQCNEHNQTPSNLVDLNPHSLSKHNFVGVHLPINPIAKSQRHLGIGFNDYILVLTDRDSTSTKESVLPESVLWLTARFPRENILLVEDGIATVVRGRSIRGTVAIATRTDLWRFMANAKATIDLKPGTLLARECIESLQYGTPIIVPDKTTAALFAKAGGGLWFSNLDHFLCCIEIINQPKIRNILGSQGCDLVKLRYASSENFVDRVGLVLKPLVTTVS